MRLITGNGGNQSLTVGFAFEYGQAEMMRAHAADQKVVAVEQQVLRRNGRSYIIACFQYQSGCFGSSDVFKHNFKIRHLRQNRLHHALDKGGFAVKNINFRIGDFAVNQEQNALFRHFFQHRNQFEQVGHAGIGIGGRARRIEFKSHDTGSLGFAHKFRSGIVGQIKRHQRLEGAAFGQGGHNARFVCLGIGNADNGRLQVGHDDRAAHLSGGVRGNGFERVTVAQV